MPAAATNSSVERHPLSFAGFPASSWAFAVRIWFAMILALYVSFWLELDSTATAATTVAILALPTRGQGLEKAAFRLIGTIIGTMAAIVIAGVLTQTDSLILAVFGVWVGLCVFVACMLDGGRAYAAVLCCVSVALAAMQNMDSPQLVFTTGMARAAAMSIGVLAVSLVNDVLAAPDYHPILASRLGALLERVMNRGSDAESREMSVSAVTDATLLREIVAMRPDITSLTTESSSGTARRAAAQSAMLGLVSATSLTRLLVSLPHSLPVNGSDWLLKTCRSDLKMRLAEQHRHIRADLQALRSATMPSNRRRAPIYRSRRIAAESGLRATASFVLIAALLVAAGWPSTDLCLALAAVFISLSVTTPNPQAFAKISVIAMPLACLLAGILKFGVLSGVSDFALLAISLAPIVIGLCLFISGPNLLLSVLARLTLVFTLLIFSPANPETYDPRTFLTTCLLAVLASILFFAAQLVIPPISGNRRIGILLAEICRDSEALGAQNFARLDPAEDIFRDASRLEQIMIAGGSASNAAIDQAISKLDLNAAVRHSYAELHRLASASLAGASDAARNAVAARNGSDILLAAAAIRDAAIRHEVNADAVCAALTVTACVLQTSPVE